MELSLTFSTLMLGFGLGLLHALDADHIMAVSSMASGNNNRSQWSVKRMIQFCSRWAIGHAATLITLAALFILAKLELPTSVIQLTEKLIGLLLISLGCWILWTLWQHKITLQTHSHDNITHTHLIRAEVAHKNHQPILVGMAHGLAGSAPILAIMPGLGPNNLWSGLTYVMLFSLGVLTTMIIFGYCLGTLQHWISRSGERLFQASRVIIALTSIAFGGFWLFASA